MVAARSGSRSRRAATTRSRSSRSTAATTCSHRWPPGSHGIQCASSWWGGPAAATSSRSISARSRARASSRRAVPATRRATARTAGGATSPTKASSRSSTTGNRMRSHSASRVEHRVVSRPRALAHGRQRVYRGGVMTFDARHGFAFAVLGATMLCAGTANAHFILTAPAADLEQDGLGDPQKDSPCGGAGTETGMITAYQAGDTVTISVEETVFHPGHFRVALAINDMSELPPEPEVTEGNTACGTVEIMDPPVFPVLADGMLLHTEQLDGEQSFDVVLPDDVECEACTLQVLMFMQQHGAP